MKKIVFALIVLLIGANIANLSNHVSSAIPDKETTSLLNKVVVVQPTRKLNKAVFFS